MHYFIVLVIISMCVKCFNIFFLFHPGFFVILILVYAFVVLVLFLIVKQILMLIMYSTASL